MLNEKIHRKKLILIDLDGVLNEYKGDYKEGYIHPPKPDTENFLKEISKNFEIKIFTTRNKLLTSKWLIENNLDKYISDITNIKETRTYLFIDDRCLNFRGDYKILKNKIQEFCTHWQCY